MAAPQEDTEHGEAAFTFFPTTNSLLGRRKQHLPSYFSFSLPVKRPCVCAAEQSIAVQLVHTIALDLVRGKMQATGKAGGRREAGTETRLTSNKKQHD